MAAVIVIPTVQAITVPAIRTDLQELRLVRVIRTAKETVTVRAATRTVMVRVDSRTVTAVRAVSRTETARAVRADLTADHDQDSAVVQAAASVWAEVPVVLFHQ